MSYEKSNGPVTDDITSWFIVLSHILLTFTSHLINVIRCVKKMASLWSVPRGSGKTEAGGAEAKAVKILPRGVPVPRGTTSLALSTEKNKKPSCH